MKIKIYITKFAIIVFSIALALGSWNPFISQQEDGGQGFSITQFVSVFFIIFLFFYRKSNKSKQLFNNWKKYLVYLFIILLFSSLFWSLSEFNLDMVMFFIKLLLAFSLCIQLPNLFSNINYLYYSVAIYAITSAIIAILFSFGFLDFFVSYSRGRMFIFNENANYTSSRIVIAVIFIFHLVLKNPLNWSSIRYMALLLIFPMINMIIASGSRGSFIILLLCIAIYFLLMPSKKPISKYFSISLFSLLIGLYIYNIFNTNTEYSLFDRLDSSINEGNTGGRDKLNEQALNIFYDYPLIGKGTSGFRNEMMYRYKEHLTVHNMYIYILATAGILGFLFFSLFFIDILRMSLKIVKKNPLPIVILVFNFVLAYKTGGVITYLLMWYLYAIIISLFNGEASKRIQNN